MEGRAWGEQSVSLQWEESKTGQRRLQELLQEALQEEVRSQKWQWQHCHFWPTCRINIILSRLKDNICFSLQQEQWWEEREERWENSWKPPQNHWSRDFMQKSQTVSAGAEPWYGCVSVTGLDVSNMTYQYKQSLCHWKDMYKLQLHFCRVKIEQTNNFFLHQICQCFK